MSQLSSIGLTDQSSFISSSISPRARSRILTISAFPFSFFCHHPFLSFPTGASENPREREPSASTPFFFPSFSTYASNASPGCRSKYTYFLCRVALSLMGIESPSPRPYSPLASLVTRPIISPGLPFSINSSFQQRDPQRVSLEVGHQTGIFFRQVGLTPLLSFSPPSQGSFSSFAISLEQFRVEIIRCSRICLKFFFSSS